MTILLTIMAFIVFFLVALGASYGGTQNSTFPHGTGINTNGIQGAVGSIRPEGEEWLGGGQPGEIKTAKY